MEATLSEKISILVQNLASEIGDNYKDYTAEKITAIQKAEKVNLQVSTCNFRIQKNITTISNKILLSLQEDGVSPPIITKVKGLLNDYLQ